MPNAAELFDRGNGAVVAPAGHGKTELIVNIAALGERALILTHTHAGVHAIRSRLKRLGIHHSQVAVDTIAGWCMRYAHAFPGVARPPADLPQSGEEWDQLHRGAALAVGVPAIRQIIRASYDRILVDEYQDCNSSQHRLVAALSYIVPTLVFGDPMQGIFEFAGATLDWDGDIHPTFPLAGTLETPHRWAGTNPDLGKWIAETRIKLMQGDPIDLRDSRIAYRTSNDAFDMGTFFEGIDGKEGSFAAIHCNKKLCYRLARAAKGGYQAIEEIAANRLRQFAQEWDRSADSESRLRSINRLLADCFHQRTAVEGEPADLDDEAIQGRMQEAEGGLGDGNGAAAAAELLSLARKRTKWKLYRSELWRDCERAVSDLLSGRIGAMIEATASARQRAGNSGRKLPRRTVSTPLLLKGLEFDHVVIPDAVHFVRERQAQAKLFYVAISRATRSLTISSSTPILRLPRP
jgi:superfamily I DNA/RNA helicase